MLKKIFALIGTTLIIVGCGVDNNVAITTTNGACPGESGAPYCLSVLMTNNGGGQNWINSTSFPISNLTMVVSGATNVASPATNKNLTDPNNCTGSTINPGSNCTFYLQITSEAYPVESQELVSTTLNYTVNNSLFGGSNNTYSTTFTVNELTNLYIMGINGVLWNYNNNGIASAVAESTPPVNSMAIDNSSFGFVYIGTNGGIYAYGLESTSSSINPNSIVGVNNLFTSSGNLYAVSTNPNSAGIWSYSLSAESWNNSGSYVYQSGQTIFATNVNTVSPSSTIYLAGGTNTGYSNIVYSCSLNSSTIGVCSTEGKVVDNQGTPAKVHSLGFLTAVNPYSGLYAGTDRGLFAETNQGESTSSWQIITQNNSDQSIIQQINSMAIDLNGSLYAGDIEGNIWVIESSPTKADKLTTLAGSSITQMVVDNNANTLYFIALNSTGYGLYSCSLFDKKNGCTIKTITTTAFSSTQIVGLAIGSQFNN